MANSTFNGPVRSENNFKVISKAASTGIVADQTVGGGLNDARRYYLEEYFAHLPGINGDLASTTESTNTPVSRDFEILGTNHTSALATYSATVAGMAMTTATADQDRMIVAPHLDTKQGAWAGTKWGTENQVQWECGIRTSAAIDNQKIWAGLKLTNDQLPQTDADQAYFYFATDATAGQVLSTYTPLYFIHSNTGTDYLTNTGITFAASTNYHLKIVIDSDRKPSIFVNGRQYSVTTSAITAFDNTTSVTGTTQATIAANYSATNANTQKGAALKDNTDLIPCIGIEAGDGAAAALNVSYSTISRLLFE